jgi:hypothetical protein
LEAYQWVSNLAERRLAHEQAEGMGDVEGGSNVGIVLSAQEEARMIADVVGVDITTSFIDL